MTESGKIGGRTVIDNSGPELDHTRAFLAEVSSEITSMGYVLSDEEGHRRRKPIQDYYEMGMDMPVFGILKEKNRLPGPFAALPGGKKTCNIADLYVSMSERWYLYIYSKKQVAKMESLADRLAAKYKVTIKVSARSLLYE